HAVSAVSGWRSVIPRPERLMGGAFMFCSTVRLMENTRTISTSAASFGTRAAHSHREYDRFRPPKRCPDGRNRPSRGIRKELCDGATPDRGTVPQQSLAFTD